jgi:hypothetical protein
VIVIAAAREANVMCGVKFESASDDYDYKTEESDL